MREGSEPAFGGAVEIEWPASPRPARENALSIDAAEKSG
jgi:hypothetical protein